MFRTLNNKYLLRTFFFLMPGIVPGDKAMNKTDIMLPAPECTFSWWPQTCREVRIITRDKYEAGGRHREDMCVHKHTGGATAAYRGQWRPNVRRCDCCDVRADSHDVRTDVVRRQQRETKNLSWGQRKRHLSTKINVSSSGAGTIVWKIEPERYIWDFFLESQENRNDSYGAGYRYRILLSKVEDMAPGCS